MGVIILAKFKIYAGLGGGFGGAQFQGIWEFADKNEAESQAYDLAYEEYESYGGYHGLYTWESMREEIADYEYGGDIDAVPNDEVDLRYNEDIESWLTYYVKEVPDDFPDDWDEDDDDYDNDADCYCDD
jgi:hypothetical protein